MPYINKRYRKRTMLLHPDNVGELTWAITEICRAFLERGPGRFADHAEVISALECAKLEFYRRILVPYENERKEENGDVF